jgi:hypothetical protein
MGDGSERRRRGDNTIFRPAGTHFLFKNEWGVSIEESDPNSIELFEVRVHTNTYSTLTFGPSGATTLHKVNADQLAQVLARVSSFNSSVSSEQASEFIAELVVRPN